MILSSIFFFIHSVFTVTICLFSLTLLLALHTSLFFPFALPLPSQSLSFSFIASPFLLIHSPSPPHFTASLSLLFLFHSFSSFPPFSSSLEVLLLVFIMIMKSKRWLDKAPHLYGYSYKMFMIYFWINEKKNPWTAIPQHKNHYTEYLKAESCFPIHAHTAKLLFQWHRSWHWEAHDSHFSKESLSGI